MRWLPLLLTAAILPAFLADTDVEDVSSLMQLNALSKALSNDIVSKAQRKPAPTDALAASHSTNSSVQRLNASVGANGTVTVVADVESEQHLRVREIFALCVTMYGSIGILWLLYWSWAKGSTGAAESNTLQVSPTAGPPEQATPFYITLVCLSWASTSVGMNIMNKSLVSSLGAPALISAVQMVIAVVVMTATGGSKFKDLPRSQLLTWMIVPLLFAGMLCSSFYAYAYISLSLLTVVRNLTPLVALPIENVVMPPERRPAISLPIVLAIMIMLAGAVIYGDGILPTLSVVGLACAFLNLSLAVSDRVLQRRLLTMECKDLPSDVCTIITNTFGLVPTLLLATATHQFDEVSDPAHKASWHDPQIWVLLLLSGIIGIGICFLGFVCQRAISATSFFVLQNVSKVAVVSAGVIVFGDPIKSPAAAGGLFLSLSGSFLYGALQMRAVTTKPAEVEKKQ
eukprot:CAMPEP_0206456174 /NCGR_PEP_ID=MMETSP0324_2-20121206/22207_1 /ASSEMBLY_ACC=CAM_ASM_000836 /TAXON_ID=2866 /ORGANISM="Crypthecodinium cohnii, Strain Seligo" /LENGTH=456 /DNA_ID=CAMNT_0053927051 /DNA_START=230 /DNA_END=1600 /DNA_ORIENTATION=-